MTTSADSLEPILELVNQQTGLSFPATRRDSALQGIQRAMERARASGPQSYLYLLRSQRSALDDLVDELTVGETYFFREPGQLDFLRRHILPEVLSRRPPGYVLRAWSAGCASGEEAYSLAILLEQEGLGGRSQVLGTDVSPAALARCRRGCYRSWSLRGQAAEQALPYLMRSGELFEVIPSLRRPVRFLHHNLVEDTYPNEATGIYDMDVILCRNVLIYLDPSAIAQVAVRLFQTLAPGGWLLLGPSDPLLGPLAPLETVTIEQGLVYRRPLKETARGAALTPDPSPSGRGEEEGLPFPQGERRKKSVPVSQGEERKHLVPFSPAPLGAQVRGGEGSGVRGKDSASEVPLTPSPSPSERGEEAGPEQVLEQVRRATAAGDYRLAGRLAGQMPGNVAASALAVRALANVDAAEAVQVCAQALKEQALAGELHHLHGVLLLGLGRLEEAEQALRRVLYLNPRLPLAHFTLGSMLWRRGDRSGARRCYAQARELACLRPPDEPLLLEEGTVGSLLAAIEAQLSLLDAIEEAGT